jgi:hypothetical protein
MDGMVSVTTPTRVYKGAQWALAATDLTVTDAGLTGSDWSVTANGANLIVGSGSVTITGAGNYSGTATAIFTITAKVITAPLGAHASSLTYTGAAQSVTIPAADGYTIGGTLSGTNAGGYTAKAILTDKANTAWSSGGTADFDITWSIAKAAAPAITFPTAAGITYGAALSTSTLTGGSTAYGTFAWTAETTVPTVANGGYGVTFTPSQNTTDNYAPITTLTSTVSIAVAKAVVQKPAVTTDRIAANGTERSAGIADDARYTVTGGTGVNSGNYSATVTLKDADNYIWDDGTSAPLTLPWRIEADYWWLTAAAIVGAVLSFFIAFIIRRKKNGQRG